MSKKQSNTKIPQKLELMSDITADELLLFLQESEEQIQLLDESIVKLEKGDSDAHLLQEIFRAAHTLKGSSAMLGHTRMADLTHSMESVLDRLRKGTLEITTLVVDALLSSLDTLRSLNEEVISLELSDTDISSVVTQLDYVQHYNDSPKCNDIITQNSDIKELSLTEDQRNEIEDALESNRKAYQVHVVAEQGTDWAAIRYFQVLNDLSTTGQIITSIPTQADIEAGKLGSDLSLIYVTDNDEWEIKEKIGQVAELQHTKIESYHLQTSEVIQKDITDTDSGKSVTSVTESSNLPTSQVKTVSHEAKTSQTVRIDVQRLDDLMNMVGELSIAHPRIHQIERILEARYKDDELVKALGETSTNAMKIVTELQQNMMQIRMLPIGTVFNSFPRMVRDLARKMDKDIDFIVEGQETEIDRTVIDHVRDPVVHLLRNAVDHGIDTLEERKALGKPQKATIRLAACHEEGHIVITVEDDGKGIDPAKVKRSALKKGVITSETASKLTTDEAMELIFSSGMSTAEKTTDVSGRGVGLDVVRKNIEALNGVVLVDTKIGEGAKFTLKMPLTLATFQGLLVSSYNTTYAIPLISVTETLRIADTTTRTVQDGEIIRIRETILPLLRLKKAFNLNGSNSIGEAYVVIVRDGSRSVGLAVDAVMEPQEVVVKSMGKFMGEVKGIAGASILGDGTVALILDAATLIRSSLAR